MKRQWGSILLGLLLVISVLAGPAAAQTGRFWLSAIGDNNEAIVNGRCLVLTAGANTLPTIYTTAALSTAASNPLTMNATTGVCEWFSSALTTTFDVLMLVDSGAYKGHRVRVDNVTRTGQHTVRVNRASSLKVLAIPYPSAAATTATADTRTLPAGALVRGVTLMTTTAVALSSLAVGHGASGAEANLCDGRAATTTPAQSATNGVGFTRCEVAPYLATASGAIRIHNQNHATAGFAFVWYTESGNEP